MASMDNAILTKVTLSTADLGLLEKRGSGRANVKERLVVELMEKPWEVMDKKNRIKDLLFPDDVLPEEMKKSNLDKNLDILAKPDGVALVFTDKLLFTPGGSTLSDKGKYFIDRLIPMITQTTAPINIAGYTDTTDNAENPLTLSGDRALAVISFMVSAGIPNQRFSLSAYGNAFPVLDERGRPVESDMNRRVEILLKTARPIGGYQ